ncbi:hypothetical protein [Nocardioides xinjiangensis]|uniref:hypothetical protein n=1 Tax=Nocardioides xinjiangensis TaxID=2817376 RepID=UPI001B305E4C|nr:hypothetical protein [Nocardioides sp. SYSU D00778]
MSLVDRLLGRSARPPAPQAAPADEALERWAATAEAASAGLGPGGRLAVALLGESLVDGPTSPWFGHEPTPGGLDDLFTALGEEPSAAAPLLDAEAQLSGRRPGEPAAGTRARWSRLVEAALTDPAAREVLPERDERHLAAERAWRAAAGAVQPWRAVQLHPGRALGQVRWYPGCETRASVGYADPLGLGMVERAVEEHRYSEVEWQALRPAADLVRSGVDALSWRLSSMRFAVEAHRGPADG